MKAILDAVMSIAPKALAIGKDKKRRHLGADLFRIYLDAFRIINTGDRIVHLLKEAVEMTDTQRRDLRVQLRWERNLHSCLYAQGDNFREFQQGVQSLGHCLAALDSDAYGELSTLAWVKRSSLLELSSMLRASGAPEIPFLGDDDYLLSSVMGDATTAPAEALALLMRGRELMPSESLNLGDPLSPETIPAIRSYLAERQPEQRLVEMREHLRLLREALERNFSLGDILISLSERQ